jgi:glycosyltransferase involved in cell wall biosynthesis
MVDLVWFNQLSLYDVYPLTILCKKLGIPTIQAYEDERHELVSSESLSLSRRLFGLNSRLGDKFCPVMADAIVTISHYLVKKYTRLSQDPNKVHLLPTIIDCNAWRCGPEPVTDVPSLLYSGFLGEQDEMENFLLALRILRNEGLRFRFVMVGGAIARDGLNERDATIQAQIGNLGLADVVEQRGFVPRDEIRSELERANILISIRRDGLWSRSGLATKLSEYLASGRAVLAAKVGDVSNYLKDGENAFLVRPNADPHEIAEALRIALSSAEMRSSIGDAGRNVALTHFDLPVAKKRLDSIFQTIFAENESC